MTGKNDTSVTLFSDKAAEIFKLPVVVVLQLLNVCSPLPVPTQSPQTSVEQVLSLRMKPHPPPIQRSHDIPHACLSPTLNQIDICACFLPASE